MNPDAAVDPGPAGTPGRAVATGPTGVTDPAVRIARVAGAPTSALAALACPAVHAGIDRTLRADVALTEAARDLLPVLQASVPALQRAPRAAALAVRRALHHDPSASPSAKDLRLLDAAASTPDEVTAPLAQHWQSYRRALTERDAARTALVLAVDEELPAAVRSATNALGDPDLLRGISFASPGFATALAAAAATGRPDCRPHKRHARSVTAYLTRTALKPSPFSTLGLLALVGAGTDTAASDTAAPDAADGTGDRSVFRPLLMSVLLAFATDPRSWPAADGQAAGTLDVLSLDPLRPGTAGTRRPAVLVPQYCASSGVWYRHDEVTELDEDWDDLRQRISAGGPRHRGEPTPEERARAVAVGLAAPRTPWSTFSPTGFRELSALLPPVDDSADGASLLTARKQLRVAAEAEQRLLDATAAAQVAAAATDIAAAAGSVLDELGTRRPAWWPSAPVAHESVATAPVPVPGDRLQRVLRPLLHRSVRITPTYSRLVELTAQRHGARSVDALTFCLDVAWAMESGLLRRPGATVPPGDLPRGYRSLAAPATAVFAQYLGDPAAPDTPIVVNKLTPAHPGVISRWASVAALRDRVTAMADDWADRRHPGCRHYQFTAAGDWTTTQRPTLRHRPLVGWGADLADPDTIPLRDFRIQLDAETRTLQILDADGQPAALGYVGAVPPYLLAGIPAVLALLADPWTSRIPLPPVPAGVPGEPGTAARVGVDGIVLRRRSWSFDRSDVPDVTGATPTESLLAVERWRRRHGLPAELFVAGVRADSPFGRADKPAWVSAQHPLTALTALRGPVLRWEVSEALPASTSTDRVIEYCSVIEHG